MKVLIVEHQKHSLEALESAVINAMPKYFAGFTKEDYNIARCYKTAHKRIDSFDYDIIILDNRVPYEDLGDLEFTDPGRFSDRLHDIGYTLIPKIKRKNPETVVIGTSSLSRSQLRTWPSPDFKIITYELDIEKYLESVLKKIKGGNN